MADGDGRLFAPPPAPTRELPAPHRQRYQPLRAGILNLWQYDRQEFRFHDGRLILRGENGTGKSKALELLLPFLLDADLSPHRLDPFAGVARTMAWNLLMDGRHESRVGYVWIELGRRETTGETAGETTGEPARETAEGNGHAPVCLTLGCGLRATRRSSRVDSWYFVTGRRVGGGLELAPGGRPLLKDALRQALGDEGSVYDTGREYRQRVDGELFGLGEDRFTALRHLLLQLRRPHLSEKLDPSALSTLLGESLPPVDPDLVATLAEGFERLDDDQRELDRLAAAAREVEGFLGIYRRYVRGIARQRAAGVRQADSRYHRCAAEVREAEEEQGRAAERLEELDRQRQETETAVRESTARIGALAGSDEMRSAEALKMRRQRADELVAQAEREEGDAAAAREERRRREAEEAAARRTLEEAEEARVERGENALTAARAARLEPLHGAVLEALEDRPSTAGATARSGLDRRQEGVEELEGLSGEVAEARGAHRRAEERRQDAEARLQGAVERRRGAEAEAGREEERLAAAVESWAAALEELRVEGGEMEELAAAALADGDGEEDRLAAAVRALAAPRRESLVERRSAVLAVLEHAAGERREAVAERVAVEGSDEIPPTPPPTRGSDRASRPGAPFYRLVEFAGHLSPAQRAGLEAALQASGLLDAWVTPGGRVLDAGTEDTLLTPTPLSGGATLADLLVPVAGAPGGVEAPVVDALLRSVASSSGDGGAHRAHRVATDGTWRLGPLRGVWSKPQPEHVGEEARRAARQRRLEELERTLEELESRIAGLTGERDGLDRRRAALDAEVAALPSREPLRRARTLLETALDAEQRHRAELTAAERAAAEARSAREGLEQRLGRRAGELGLSDVVADLAAYRLALKDYEAALDRLLAAARSAAAAATARAAAGEELTAARQRADEVERRGRESRQRAGAAAAELEELEATVGVEAARVVERHRREVARRDELRRRREELREAREEVARSLAQLDGRLEVLRRNLDEHDGVRQEAATGLRRLAEAGVLSLVLGPSPGPSPTEEGAEAEEAEEESEAGAAVPSPAEWSFTRSLEIAREIERRTAEVVDLGEEAASRRSNRMYERYQQLAADLGADFQLGLDQRDDLARVEAIHGGRTYDVPALLAMLRADVETRRELLMERERELLRRFLLGEVGDHLRGRLREARRLVDDMNRLLEECATASGMTLRLSWRPADDSGPEVRRAVDLLLRDLALLKDGERRWLEGFFQGRIERAREEAEAVPWRDHLRQALDYRRWYAFTVQRRGGDDGGWQPLTRRGHAAISGGEKAVALHLPLFAAAAAHYASARDEAPRLILLDEAFAGIDAGMRGRCMGLLTRFDLDFMMTSYDEWGCYAQLPGVATYQLHRDPDLEGVAAVRFVWDGETLQDDG